MTLTERHIQAVWYDAALRPDQLYTRGGSPVTVISPGEWNLEAGPDFKNAVLEIGEERRRIVGDVEVHLCPRDWDLHGHGGDPNYHNVIAHVTWQDGPNPRTLPRGAVSIWLGRFLSGSPSFSFEAIDLLSYPFARLPMKKRPCERYLERNPALARKTLVAIGRHRLRLKAMRLAGRLCEASAREHQNPFADTRRQVYYEEMMTSLGYKHNSKQFRHIAERVPLSELPNEEDAARTALLTAGTFESFDYAGMRPNNQPEKRLGNAARVFIETPAIGFAEANDFSKRGCRKMVKGLCGNHCMWRGRAAAVVANVILPFAMAEGRIDCVPEWLPPEDISSPVRVAAFRMFGRDHNPRALYAGNGVMIQGLIEVYNRWCRNLICESGG